MMSVPLLSSLDRRSEVPRRSGVGILAVLGVFSTACGSQRFEAGAESDPHDGAVTVAETTTEAGHSETSWIGPVSATSDAGGSSSVTATSEPSAVLDSGAGVDEPASSGLDGAATFVDLDASAHVTTANESVLDAGVTSVATREALADASSGSSDRGADADVATADGGGCQFGEFQQPSLVLGLDFDDRLWGPAVSRDGQVLLFGYTGGDEDLFQATNTGNGARNFGDVTALAALNTGGNEGTPFLSNDGLTLYFYATRPAGPGDRDLWFATRNTTDDEFDEPHQLMGVNGESYDHLPWLSDDELMLYYTTEREGGLGHSDIWQATRLTKSDAFDDHRLVAGINSESREDAIAFSPDRLTAYFTTDRATDGNLDIWQATRASLADDFDHAEAIPGLNSDAEDTNLALTGDGTRLYFSSGRDGHQRLWVAVRSCL